MSKPEAVFFDVDFTLIHPGRRFQADGYFDSCARHGIEVDAGLFDRAVAGAARVLDDGDQLYDAELFVRYTARIIELMGGRSSLVDKVARELYADWAEHHHFSLYDDVQDTLRTLVDRGLLLGLISNSHRCLVSFQSHFELNGLLSVVISSAELGFMKPHPAIFRAALDGVGIPADRAVMVGDSLTHDIEGALGAGMRGVLLARGGAASTPHGVPVITSLRELPGILQG